MNTTMCEAGAATGKVAELVVKTAGATVIGVAAVTLEELGKRVGLALAGTPRQAIIDTIEYIANKAAFLARAAAMTYLTGEEVTAAQVFIGASGVVGISLAANLNVNAVAAAVAGTVAGTVALTGAATGKVAELVVKTAGATVIGVAAVTLEELGKRVGLALAGTPRQARIDTIEYIANKAAFLAGAAAMTYLRGEEVTAAQVFIGASGVVGISLAANLNVNAVVAAVAGTVALIREPLLVEIIIGATAKFIARALGAEDAFGVTELFIEVALAER